MTRRVTLVDLAERADVSVATVSRALSGDPQISEATQSRIRRIATDLKYVPNVAARSLGPDQAIVGGGLHRRLAGDLHLEAPVADQLAIGDPL